MHASERALRKKEQRVLLFLSFGGCFLHWAMDLVRSVLCLPTCLLAGGFPQVVAMDGWMDMIMLVNAF